MAMMTWLVVVVVPVTVVVPGTEYQRSVILFFFIAIVFKLTGSRGCLGYRGTSIESDGGLVYVNKIPTIPGTRAGTHSLCDNFSSCLSNRRCRDRLCILSGHGGDGGRVDLSDQIARRRSWVRTGG